MKTYIVVEGTKENIKEFEIKVSQAIDEGYMLVGNLIVCPFSNSISLYQSLILEDQFLEEEELNNDEVEELEPRL